MNTYEVLNLLKVSRPTLTHYVKQGFINVEKLPNGRLKKHKQYVGKQIKGGLSRGLNYLLNADVNGALNILRKVVGDDFIQNLSDRGCWFQPVRMRDMFQPSHEQFIVKTDTIT
ncbi:MAG: hypothetical protein BAJALOKI1v1_420017 [Promethearchaeota archaeon]|nr:MAG: hypothetical protein BAJALOKI1v1_420017 [Candidatus Lokiarchaeota archaeon]